jgi:Flp pilus assembly protein TadG
MIGKLVHPTHRLFPNLLQEQNGQVIPWVVLMATILLGIAGLVLDLGRAYIGYRELQSATDAAALAGAQNLKSSNAATIAKDYSALTGELNAQTSFTSVKMLSGYPKFECLTTIKNMGVGCIAPNTANAVQVIEQATIPTFFSEVFGIGQMTLTATSTAAVVGARAAPMNIAIVIDTTESMGTVDTNCGNTRLNCALNGVQILLSGLSPCSPAAGACTVTNGVATGALDQVSVFTFPPVTTATVADDYNCSGANPTIVPYTLPTYNATSYAPSGSTTGTYEITGFLSDYRTSDAATTLNTTSDLSMVVGAGTKNGRNCAGMSDPGGDGTYYAGAIYAAQSALIAEYNAEGGANAVPLPQNIMIVLSDGEANASASKMNSSSNSAWNTSGTYPSAKDQCQQAVEAADYAKNAGTTVYSVAYGSESSGCTTDSSNMSPINEANITPCQVMSQIASGAAYFYSDYNQSGSSSTCESTGTSVTSLNDIFTAIINDLLVVRLIPNSTT